ncbi:hypothetical protein [Nocardioides sp. cx-173]|uniref:hypothetical protein n=1 Tax=Nocardioides sp. cx-173 TaxID=2898796 RepID=UPI001E4D9580|nr:hypothetical protein [Nocardioides sp. cx-173]MCD4527151.1 hypothetical protein [Nocardioides sp. cx-173]UGB40492.1 hypothetical protein LQ940_14010 [Nocardioides sp. cx-173]
MTMDTSHLAALDQPARLAAAARSVLACPSAVSLVVDGVQDPVAGTTDLGMQDLDGTPAFSVVPGTVLSQAARRGSSALLTVESGLGPLGSADRDATLTLTGTLHNHGREDCDCCGEVRDVVTLSVGSALLVRAGRQSEERFRVSLPDFRSSAHRLNRGYLQRCVEHANRCHQQELRRAVAGTSGTPLSQVVGVSLSDLRPDGVGVHWVDPDGAHTRTLSFSRAATTTEELGDLLREELRA